MRRNVACSSFVAAAALACGTLAEAMTGDSVAAPFRGTWVPAAAACTSPLKLLVEPTAVTFVNAADRAEFRRLDQCFSCMGRDVQNVTLLSTDAMGDSPFMLYLDATKKKPALTADLGNDKKLAARFPLGKGGLKHCP